MWEQLNGACLIKCSGLRRICVGRRGLGVWGGLAIGRRLLLCGVLLSVVHLLLMGIVRRIECRRYRIAEGGRRALAVIDHHDRRILRGGQIRAAATQHEPR